MVKSLVKRELDIATLLCLRDGRLTKFQDSLLGMVEISLYEGPIFFNCNNDLTLKLRDKNILKAIELNVKLQGFNIMPSSYPITIVYKMYYKTTNNLNHKRTLGSTIYCQTNPLKGNIHVPKTLARDQISLHENWLLKKAVLAPR